MTTVPTSAPETPFWHLPATRLAVFQTVLGPILVLIGALVTLYFNNAAQARDITRLQEKTAVYDAAKEDRGSRLSVLENEVKTMHQEQRDNEERRVEEMKEVRSDIKLLLQRGAK